MSNRASGDQKVGVAYLRVSTEEQHLGPEAQRSAIAAWAAAAGVTVVSWHTDAGIGGSKELEHRPGLVAALGSLRAAGAGLLVVARRDRLARDVGVALAIERAVQKSGAKLVAADGAGNGDTAADAFMRHILNAAAEYERALIAARTKAALATKRARGERVGTVPFGLEVAADGRLCPCASEQAVLCSVRALRASGLSLRAIARECAKRGLRSRVATPLTATQVHRMLRA